MSKKINKKPKYKSGFLKSLHLAVTDLHSVGAIDDKTKERFDNNCLKKGNDDSVSSE